MNSLPRFLRDMLPTADPCTNRPKLDRAAHCRNKRIPVTMPSLPLENTCPPLSRCHCASAFDVREFRRVVCSTCNLLEGLAHDDEYMKLVLMYSQALSRKPPWTCSGGIAKGGTDPHVTASEFVLAHSLEGDPDRTTISPESFAIRPPRWPLIMAPNAGSLYQISRAYGPRWTIYGPRWTIGQR